jgi:hypothetical protein
MEFGKMSIKSHAFGRVMLTGSDAKKFRDQVKYGRPKAAAKVNVTAGIELSTNLQQSGSLKFKLKELV